MSHITSCEIDHEHHVDFVSHTWYLAVPFSRLPCPSTKRHVMLNLTSTGVCNTGTSSLYVCNLLWLTWCWMLLYQTFRKITSTNMRKKKLYVVTPTCDAAAAAVVSALVLWRPTKEYTHPYSMMHRRLPTAGIKVAPHYHQLLVRPVYSTRVFWSLRTMII